MLEAIFSEGITTVTLSGLTQWDYGRNLYVKGLDLPDNFEIHFSDVLKPVAIVMQGKKQGTDYVCEVPNVLLESNHDIYGYIYLDDGQRGVTVREIVLRVKTRQKPADYVSENNASEVIDQVAKAKEYADNAKASETNAKSSENASKQSADYAQAQADRIDEILENVPDFNSYETLSEHDKMLYGGLYEQGETYSGKASNKGIKLHKVVGKTQQKITNGYQLFDASKLPTKSQGGATVTNNGDGSFTVSGSGNLTSNFNNGFEVDKSLFKVGKITLINSIDIYPRLGFTFYDANTAKLFALINNGTFDITQDLLDSTSLIVCNFYGDNGGNIKTGTVKPMLYQDGTGEWEQFTGGQPSPNPDYPQEIENVEVKKIES